MSASTLPPAEAWTEWAGVGRRLVFTHANGFPPGSYRELLTGLATSFEVATFAHRPLWSADDPAELESWHPMAHDLESALRERDPGPVIGVGHSLGGVLCALAAARAPELFSCLVLLDPVVFTGGRSWLWGAMQRLGMARRFPLAVSAARRRDTWPDRARVRASWSVKGVFSSWHPRAFEDYLESGLVDMPDGSVTLRYPRAWEARIFEACPATVWSELRRVRNPVLVIRGETSDTLTRAAARRMEREMPNAQIAELAGASHFLPMERPNEVARLVIGFAERIGRLP